MAINVAVIISAVCGNKALRIIIIIMLAPFSCILLIYYITVIYLLNQKPNTRHDVIALFLITIIIILSSHTLAVVKSIFLDQSHTHCINRECEINQLRLMKCSQ